MWLCLLRRRSKCSRCRGQWESRSSRSPPPSRRVPWSAAITTDWTFWSARLWASSCPGSCELSTRLRNRPMKAADAKHEGGDGCQQRRREAEHGSHLRLIEKLTGRKRRGGEEKGHGKTNACNRAEHDHVPPRHTHRFVQARRHAERGGQDDPDWLSQKNCREDDPRTGAHSRNRHSGIDQAEEE